MNIIKLNGTAGRAFKTVIPKVYNEDEAKKDALKEISDYYKVLSLNGTGEWGIQYAFDLDNQQINKAREKSKDILTQTDHLIIIGYSFPTFNREIDYEFLKSLKPHANIHLQTHKRDYLSVKQRLEALLGFDGNNPQIKVYTDTREFLIPFEFHGVKKDEEYIWINKLV